MTHGLVAAALASAGSYLNMKTLLGPALDLENQNQQDNKCPRWSTGSFKSEKLVQVKHLSHKAPETRGRKAEVAALGGRGGCTPGGQTWE